MHNSPHAGYHPYYVLGGHFCLLAFAPESLDVTIQAQILALMEELRDNLNTAIILITRDLGVVAETADRVLVMYACRKVEEAAAVDRGGRLAGEIEGIA